MKLNCNFVLHKGFRHRSVVQLVNILLNVIIMKISALSKPVFIRLEQQDHVVLMGLELVGLKWGWG